MNCPICNEELEKEEFYINGMLEVVWGCSIHGIFEDL